MGEDVRGLANRRWSLAGLLGGVGMAVAMAFAPASAQQITGTPGSPNATTTIDGHVLPPPPQKFGGDIELNAAESKPYWPMRVVPPKGAPNILLILTDDVGFAAPSTFGGVIPTPALDRIADNGLRYTNFHTTSLCSPTRAALITGRNHHSVGFGVVSEQSSGFPGYNQHHPEGQRDHRPRSCVENGYRTSWFGKDHNTPTYQASQAGPFDQWPTGMGFDYFYGFIGGDTSQWEPNLFRNTTAIYPYRRAAGEMEPDHGDGGRRHPLAEPAQRHRSVDAVLSLLRAGRHACAALSRRRSGSRRSATCISSTRAGTRCAIRSSPTRRSSA